MRARPPAYAELFDQLGLPSTQADITRFVRQHSPLPRGVTITEAPFWNPAQADFLSQQIGLDAEWAMLVDTLNVQLHQTPGQPH